MKKKLIKFAIGKARFYALWVFIAGRLFAEIDKAIQTIGDGLGVAI